MSGLVCKRAHAQRSDERTTRVIGRREFLSAGGALCLSSALAGCAPGLRSGRPQSPPPLQSSPPVLTLPRLHASTDRITTITVCTRPFRAQGPRLDVEQVGRKAVIFSLRPSFVCRMP